MPNNKDLERAILDQLILVINTKKPRVSQAALAKHAGGISRESINNYLNGRRAMPLDVLVAICDKLDISLNEIVRRAYSQLDE